MTAKNLVARLRSRAWEDRQHRELREAAADEIERLERKVAAYESMESLMAGVERAFSGAPPGNADVLAAAKSIVRTADETDVPHSVAWLYEQLSNCREAMSESLRNGGRTDWRQYIDALDAILLRRTSEKTEPPHWSTTVGLQEDCACGSVKGALRHHAGCPASNGEPST